MSTRQAIEERAKRIVQYYLRHGEDRKRTCDHFMDEGINRRTIVNVLRRYEGELSTSKDDTVDDNAASSKDEIVVFKKPLGRKPSVTTPEMFEKISKLFLENPDLSCREAADQLKLSRTSIFRVIRKMKENNIEINKDIVTERRCPTCHQRIKDPKVLDKLRKN